MEVAGNKAGGNNVGGKDSLVEYDMVGVANGY